MVGNRTKSRVVFAIFLGPALALYLFFAIWPLLQGFWLSTTNWDGSAPWTPAQMAIEKFESDILGKIKKSADREFLLRFYVRDEGQGTYRKQEVYGLDRYRVQRIINATGFVNPNFSNVGLKNYRDIFAGRIDKRFFPERYTETKFQPGDPIENLQLIPQRDFEDLLLPHIKNTADLAYIRGMYALGKNGYVVDATRIGTSEVDLQMALVGIPGLEDDWEALFNGALDLGAQQREVTAMLDTVPAIMGGRIASSDLALIRETAAKTAELGKLKGILANNYFRNRLRWGVLLFTVVFVVLNVVIVNALGMLLALALDTKMRSRNLLRSIFFIPNVLSMIIVAFVWQLVFRQLLPAITGISEWMMNPDLAPWLTIFVSVWQGVGYYTVIYLAGLQSIPSELIESASLDGASGVQLFFSIVLPLLVPAITICLFLSISGSLKTFDIIFALYPSNSTSMGVDNITVNIFYDAFRDKNAGLATAKAILLLFTIMIITGTQLVLSKRKEVEL